ncbi:alpha/beta fold hydrolase [Daejeonella lutea]|uniref:Pimeloyl-ACP methyl ester carboxylesterase n=1 Tax=Daejeonella lutea TaxID=572036 RepID=A0A1T5F4U3_9SPHI|nr:alpha/beta hydrolase [Daejeonella lutea]SKB91121.1 Pimeloyl-ACP methyl ester carboxylesterase [Daejeonella lutea]
MTDHYFSNDLVVMHYYKFGAGPKNMFCFHGYGMHGRQFRVLEETLGDKYTFYGFDLFFHKGTLLKDQSVAAVKKGITKQQLAELFRDFCSSTQVDNFSIIAYSMGSHYATSLIEEMAEQIQELFIAAPSSLKPGRLLTFLSSNSLGNKVLERMALSNNGMTRMLSVLRRTRIIDQKGYDILFKEVSSPDQRFSFYACASYMRFLKLDAVKFVSMLNKHEIKSVFIFGERDRNYPPKIGQAVIPKINFARQLVINENHDMINRNFANELSVLLNDY